VNPRHRLLGLTTAGLVDSLCLSTAWTVLLLEVVEQHGLRAAGMCSAAMLVGVGLSAPVAGWAGRRLTGRHLLRAAALVEAVLRLSVAALVLGGAPVWALALGVTALNVVAWTAYAGMRAEVAALELGGAALTGYGTVVAAVEAGGVAIAALLPVHGPSRHGVLLTVMACYVLALVPQMVVAGGSRVPRSAPPLHSRRERIAAAVSPPVVSGLVLMLLASAPTLLSVALAERLHGRSAVAVAALAFTAGSLLAPAVAGSADRRNLNTGAVWWLCGTGMLAGWVLAPQSVVWLCVAQALSGLFMTLLEGLLDNAASRYHPSAVTAALATASAGRAFGSAAGTAVLPLLASGLGLSVVTGSVTTLLLIATLAASCLTVAHRRPRAAIPATPSFDPTATIPLPQLPLLPPLPFVGRAQDRLTVSLHR
jgi:hypothetical protein